jgi:hypothetical protein
MDRAQLIPTHPMRYFTCGNFGTRPGFAENEATTPSNDLQWHDNLCQRCRPAIPTLAIDGTRISGLARIRRERSAIFTEAGAAEADVSLAASPARPNRSRATLCRYPIAGALGTEIAGAISRQISTATRSQQSGVPGLIASNEGRSLNCSVGERRDDCDSADHLESRCVQLNVHYAGFLPMTTS